MKYKKICSYIVVVAMFILIYIMNVYTPKMYNYPETLRKQNKLIN